MINTSSARESGLIRSTLVLVFFVVVCRPVCGQLQVGGFTAAAGSNYDLSAGSTFKVPVAAGATAAASGSIIFDSTASNLHSFLNGADAILGGFASAPTTGDVVSATVSAGNVRLSDAGFLASTVVKGAGNLATGGNPGPVPYVSAAGTLNEDVATSFGPYVDATNHRFGIGVAAPAVILDVTNLGTTGSARIGRNSGQYVEIMSTSSSNLIQTDTAGAKNLTIQNLNTGNGIIINAGTSSGSVSISAGTTGAITLTPGTGAVQVLGTLAVGLLNNSLGTLTASILDRTASTGATNVYIGSDNNGHVSATTTRFNLSRGSSDAGTTNTFVTDASQSFSVVAAGLTFKAGSNARTGTGTLVGGTLAVANTSITANSQVFVQDTGGGVIANIGSIYVASQTATTGFTVTSSNALDTSTFRYWIYETN